MPSKFIIFIKSIARKWFIFLIIFILIFGYFNWIIYENLTATIILTIIVIAIFIISYIPRIYSSNKLEKFMKKYYRVEDKTVAKKLRNPLSHAQEQMFELSQKQIHKKKWQFWIKEKNWLIIFHDKHYIFYHGRTIDDYKKLYSQGFGDKEILDKLKKHNVATRAEVKAIEENLIKYNRMGEREISVREKREQVRFQDI
jgi:hypothetical protein